MKDNRDPQTLGEALHNLRRSHPTSSAHERADILDKIYKESGAIVPQILNVNANGNGSHAYTDTDN